MHHLATLPVFFISAILAIIFGIATQVTFARSGFSAVKNFAEAPFPGFGATPSVRRGTEAAPPSSFVAPFVFAGLAALAALTALASGIANLLVFFKSVA